MTDVRPELLGWMLNQDFALIRTRLLPAVEGLVVAEHRALFGDLLGEPWTPPAAYRWLRYEDPLPVARLADGVERLRQGWARAEAEGRPGTAGARDRFLAAAASEAARTLDLARSLGYPG